MEDNTKKIIAIDASTLDAWDNCKKYYELRYIKNLQKAYRERNIEYGSLEHLMLKNYYLCKMLNVSKLKWNEDFSEYELISDIPFDFSLAVESSIILAYQRSSDLQSAEVEETIHIFRGYCDKYRDENWEILVVEKPFAATLYDSELLQIIGQGICDLIVKTPIGLSVVDHKKRSKRQEENSFAHQRLMYTYVMKIPTFITNKLVFIKDPDRYMRQTDSYDLDQHREWLEEVVSLVKEMLAYEKIGYYRRNPTSCDKFGGCTFKNFCNKTPSRRELMIGRDFFESEKWDAGKQLEKEIK